MRFGIANQPRRTDHIVERATLAEESGFDVFGLTDTQSLARELYTTMGAVAGATERIELAPSVTNPVTRHPVVTASAICTINEFTGGRAVLGIASGDSAVHTVGAEPAGFERVMAAARLMRTLVSGDASEWEGHHVKLEWMHQHGEVQKVPILVAAGGPRTLSAAGGVADRVLVSWGVNPPAVRDAAERVRTGARAAGREPDDVSIWVHAWARLRDPTHVDPETIDAYTRSELAACAHLNYQFGNLDAKRVPESLRVAVRDLVSSYDSHQHMGFAADEDRSDDNRLLVERHGLSDFLSERFLVTGSIPSIIDQMQALDGVADGVLFNPVGDVARLPEAHIREFVTRLGQEVIPNV